MPRARSLAALLLGLATTIAISWALAATPRPGASRQGLLLRPAYFAPFGRSEEFGRTRLSWTALAETGAPHPAPPDPAAVLPSWSRAQSLPGPFPAAADYPRLPRTLEVATGWPFRDLRAEFLSHPPGAAPPGGNPYETVRGIPLRTRAVSRGVGLAFLPAALPYDPIWPGLLGNTILYTACWLALLIGLPAARRRARRRTAQSETRP